MRSRAALALSGLVAGVAGVAVSLALTQLLSVRATPIYAVGEVVIVVTPGPVAEALISVVGRYDKTLLVIGVSVVVLLLSALAGVLAGRRPLLGNLVFVAMALVALAALVARPGFTPIAVLPLAAGTATWVVVLAMLVQAVPVPAPAAGGTGTSRRGFLVRVGAVAVVAAAVGAGGQLLGRSRKAVETSRGLLRLPVTRGRVPVGAQLEVPGLTPWRVPNDSFYRIDTAIVVPTIEPSQWRLRIHGMVDRELTLTYRDLLEREMTQAWVTLCCVSNEVGGDLIGNAWWSGVRIADLLEAAGVQEGADAVLQTSEDGWTCGTPIEALTDDRNALLAIAMNGEPLPIEHGFPVRMVVPGLYGYVSATKWLVDLEVTTYSRFTAYWTERGWSPEGPVKTQSRVEVPRSGTTVPPGSVPVGGSAWAQQTGIASVEYRLDGGPWLRAKLGKVPGRDTWVQWVGSVEAAEGDHVLTVRAKDESGYTQTPVRTDVVPDGATGWHQVEFSAG